MRDVMRKGLLGTVVAPMLGIGVIAPLSAGMSIRTAFFLGGFATLSLVITLMIIAFLSARIPVTIRTGVSVLIAAGTMTAGTIAVSPLPASEDLMVYTCAPFLFMGAVVASVIELYAVKRRLVTALFDGAGVGLCFTLLLSACAALQERAGNLCASVPGIFIIAACAVLFLGRIRFRTPKGSL